jgi:hypothetical protein
MIKQFTTIAVTALAVIAIEMPIITDADAKGFRSSSSFSRSSFRSSGSSSSSFSSYKSKSSYSSKSSSSSKTTTTSSKKTSNTKTTSSKFGKSSKPASYKTVSGAKQTRTAKAALKNQRAKFKKQPSKTTTAYTGKPKYTSNSTYSKARSSNPSTYHTRRNSYYAGYTAPSYVYYGSPSYGMWDTIFLYSMLSSMNNNNNAGQFAHNYSNDADYQQWRREADTLAQDNAELRAQLAQLDAQSAKLAGTPVVDGYVPAGVDADIMMSQEAITSMKPALRVCVGSQSGAYFRVVAGIMAPGVNSANMVAVTTSGTPEILANLADGTCDAGFTQGDGYWNYVEANQTTNLPFERVFSPYKEAVHLVCNEDGPTTIADLDESNRVWFPSNSGAAETWKNFMGERDDYSKVNTVLNDPSMKVSSYEEALLKVSSDKNSCAMYVAAPGSTTLMANIDKGAKQSKMVLIDVEDGKLDNTTDPSGADVYAFKNITAYKALQRKGGCYGYCSGDIESLFVNADFLVSNKWKKANSTAYNTLAVELLGMTPEITAAVKQ